MPDVVYILVLFVVLSFGSGYSIWAGWWQIRHQRLMGESGLFDLFTSPKNDKDEPLLLDEAKFWEGVKSFPRDKKPREYIAGVYLSFIIGIAFGIAALALLLWLVVGLV